MLSFLFLISSFSFFLSHFHLRWPHYVPLKTIPYTVIKVTVKWTVYHFTFLFFFYSFGWLCLTFSHILSKFTNFQHTISIFISHRWETPICHLYFTVFTISFYWYWKSIRLKNFTNNSFDKNLRQIPYSVKSVLCTFRTNLGSNARDKRDISCVMRWFYS